MNLTNKAVSKAWGLGCPTVEKNPFGVLPFAEAQYAMWCLASEGWQFEA